jgi:ubiquitin-like 1-activating enzyme E1 B
MNPKNSTIQKMMITVRTTLVVDVSQTGSNLATAAEIANLRKEAQALKAIRESMGSSEFYQKVFDKVFKEDIERLRGMEDMWKTRKAPEPLDLEKLQQESSSIDPIVSVNDQKVWSTAEDFVVFKDRFVTLHLTIFASSS